MIDLNHISRRHKAYGRSLKETAAWKCSAHGVCLLGPRSRDIKQSLCSFAWRPWGSGFCAYSSFFLTQKHKLITARNGCIKTYIYIPLFIVDLPQNSIWYHAALRYHDKLCFYRKENKNTSVFRTIITCLEPTRLTHNSGKFLHIILKEIHSVIVLLISVESSVHNIAVL